MPGAFLDLPIRSPYGAVTFLVDQIKKHTLGKSFIYLIKSQIMGMAQAIILVIYLLVAGAEYLLEYLNISHLKRFSSAVPEEFEGLIDRAFLEKAQSYTVEKTGFAMLASLFESVVLLVFLFGGFLALYNRWIISLGLSFAASGILFVFVLSFAQTLLSMPWRLYNTFVIEKKYGFSNMTPALWAMDLIKSSVIAAVLMSIMVWAGLSIYGASPDLWWLWLWGFFLAYSVFMMYISPYVIEPLFNKFERIEDKALEEGIRAMAEKTGIRISRVFKIDASKRTAHTNAYFTGIGRVKRIVLYDTLLKKLERSEIIAVLAHEIGHWKRRHLLKAIIVSEVLALFSLYLSYYLLKGDFLDSLFQISDGSFFTKVVILGFLGSLIMAPVGPLMHYVSRRHEREADKFACGLTGGSKDLIGALVKLSKDNLANLHPHPLYAAIHYSHPPVVERIKEMKRMGLKEV